MTPPVDNAGPSFRRRWNGCPYLIAGCVLVMLVLARLALPFIAERYVNRTLGNMGHYEGHVDGISLHLIRGAYTFDNLVIRKRQAPVEEPLVASPHVDVAVSWDTLIRGTVAARIRAERPSIHFAAGGNGKGAQTGMDQDWATVVDKLIPIRIDQLDIDHGEIHYLDRFRTPQVDLHFTHVDAVLRNLTNIRDRNGERRATLKATALVMDDAPFELSLATDPFQDNAAYKLEMNMRNLDVHRMQPAMRAYLPFDAESGTLDLYVDAQGNGNHYKGNIRPIFHHLELLKWHSDLEAQTINPLKLATKAVGSVLNLAFQNQRKQQLAADIPFQGVLGHTAIDIASTLGSILENAFVKALDPTAKHTDPDVDSDAGKKKDP